MYDQAKVAQLTDICINNNNDKSNFLYWYNAIGWIHAKHK
jgi:hypothetical protein